MFLSHKKGLKLDGNNPTLLYGYGGFNISLTPASRSARLAWMEMGGVYARPTCAAAASTARTGTRPGTKLKKQNVFDDFIAAAEWLIARSTRAAEAGDPGRQQRRPARRRVHDAAARPVRRCLPAVGVMDMLRFHKFTIGRFWVDDYGSSDDPEEFKALYAYSPLPQPQEGDEVPADAGDDRRHTTTASCRRTASSSPRRCRRPGRATTRC
jgi:prolyl oligopeptidase